MSAEEQELQSQSGYDDGMAGGPGAPTPLSALEVLLLIHDRCLSGTDYGDRECLD